MQSALILTALLLTLFIILYFPVVATRTTPADLYFLHYNYREQCRSSFVETAPDHRYVVIPDLSAGLGNQLFKVSAAIVYGVVNKKAVRIPKNSGHNPHAEKERYAKTIFIQGLQPCGLSARPVHTHFYYFRSRRRALCDVDCCRRPKNRKCPPRRLVSVLPDLGAL